MSAIVERPANARTPLEREIFDRHLAVVQASTSRSFGGLLLAQWLLAVTISVVVSPYSWDGGVRHVHLHVWIAIVVGGVINALPLMLLRKRPSWWLTRQSVAVAQMLWSGLLIHVTGGRIETHFHIFGSLAFLAFYRDWRLLPTATLVVVADHVARGLLWPESVYGVSNPEWWRFLEHGAWVLFESVVLALGCLRLIDEMHVSAGREAELEALNSDVERRVELRTSELTVANQSLAKEMTTRLQMEAELRQAQKLESVGRLAAGVAHEINTPVQFVSDSVHFVRDAMTAIFRLVSALVVVERSVLDGRPSREAADDAGVAVEEADLPYLTEHVPRALDRALEGLERVAVIVRWMKEFAHPDQNQMHQADLNRAITSTLTIARNEYKYVADVDLDLGDIPTVCCLVGALNQAVLNIVVNAAHAIGDAVAGTSNRGRIGVRTRRDGDDVVISISDTGGGIPADIQGRIFDPFFTTKEVGRGTGQGLSISRSVVVEQHGGQIDFETEAGKGTTFLIRLPIDGASAGAAS